MDNERKILQFPSDLEQDATEFSVNPTDLEWNTVPDKEERNPQMPLPRPVTKRINLLFAGSVLSLLVGIVMSSILSDPMLLVLTFIVVIGLATKAYLLRRKVLVGGVYVVSGTCIAIVPCIMGRYMKSTLLDVETGKETDIILPKDSKGASGFMFFTSSQRAERTRAASIFKIGHNYMCYFDRPVGTKNSEAIQAMPGFAATWFEDMDLPTNGFLGFEDLGIYQEPHNKPDGK